MIPYAPDSQSSAGLVESSNRIDRFRHHLVFSMPVTAQLA
jgi:hypothetical protein